jgi:hypothetical protein
LSEDSKIVVSEELKHTNSDFIKENFLQYEGRGLLPPKNYNPDPKFLDYHREIIFKP